jgi:hypothetical protein
MPGSQVGQTRNTIWVMPSRVMLKAMLILLLGFALTGAAVAAQPASIRRPASVGLSQTATPEPAGRDDVTGQCEVSIVPNPALTGGAVRVLMVSGNRSTIETITITAMNFQDPASAAEVMDQWSQVLLALDEFYAARGSFQSPPPGTTPSFSVQRAEVPVIGDETEAVVGFASLTDSAGETVAALPYAGLAFQDGTAGYLMLETQAEVERDPGEATPGATGSEPTQEAVLAQLTALARDIDGRAPGGTVMWSPERGHCVGGMFDTLPEPKDLADAEVVLEQHLLPPEIVP